jgi:hypothetical protein
MNTKEQFFLHFILYVLNECFHVFSYVVDVCQYAFAGTDRFCYLWVL